MQTEDPTPGIIAAVTTTIKKIINSIITMKQFAFLNTLLAVTSLEASDEGIYLNEAQAEAINTALEANQQIVTERDTARTERTTLIASLDAIDPTVAAAATPDEKILAIRAFIASKPAVAPVAVVGTGTPVAEEVSEGMARMYALPHMQE
jgi:hypothetical protein